MKPHKILLCGDSFAADWSSQYPNSRGWPNLLAQRHRVTNLAQAGCSEYRIYLQLASQDLTQYSAVIVSHTSPYRIYVADHPVHDKHSLHAHSDLIYSDVKEHAFNNPELQPLVDYFEKWFDLGHARFVHALICEKIDRMVKDSGCAHVHLVNLEWKDLYQFDSMIDLGDRFQIQPGQINHYDLQTNLEIFQMIDLFLEDQIQ